MKYTNKHGLPRSITDAIISGDYDLTQSDPYRIGVTTLINPPILRLLQVKHWEEIEEDVSEHLWRVYGDAAHYFLSKLKNPDRIIEEKLEEVVDGVTIVAKPDLYDWPTEKIEDHKMTSVWKIKFGEYDDWERQLNCYAWMLRMKGLNVKGLSVNAFLKDFRKSEIRKFENYPQIPFQLVQIKLWTFDKQDKYIKERVKIYKENIIKDIKDVPVCSPEERWQKDSVWAIYKNKNKTASKLANSEKEAKQWIKKNENDKDKFRIVLRQGVDGKCTEYCNVNRFCPYWQETYGSKKM